MCDAAKRLIGTHDFAGFAAAGHGRTSTVRTIHDCRVHRDTPELHVLVEGDGFLYNMVRIIAGTLVEVGRGRFTPDIIDRMLETADRSLGGPTLPARGLSLEWIKY
jgi:tRNA pseudouridine38-40 synthase